MAAPGAGAGRRRRPRRRRRRRRRRAAAAPAAAAARLARLARLAALTARRLTTDGETLAATLRPVFYSNMTSNFIESRQVSHYRYASLVRGATRIWPYL